MITTNPCPPSAWAPYFGKARRANGYVGSLMFGALGATKDSKVILCPKCQRPRRDLGGAHSPHFNAALVQVDCVGDVVPVVPAPAPSMSRPPENHSDPVSISTEIHPPEPGQAMPGSYERTVDPQAAELERVSERLGRAIVAFCTPGRSFHADELRAAVKAACGEVAPASADRVLRDLRQRGVVAYRCTSRSQSLYTVEG